MGLTAPDPLMIFEDRMPVLPVTSCNWRRFVEPNRKRMPRAAMEKPLLVVHQGALGDFIATFPVLSVLGRMFAPIDAICRDSFGILARHLGLIRRHEPLEAARFATLYGPPLDPAVRRRLANYHSIVLFSFSETLEKTVQRAGGRVFRIPPWPGRAENVSVARFLAGQLRDSGIFGAGNAATLETHWQDGANPPAPSQPRRILLAPGAGSAKKRWPLPRFLSLAGQLAGQGLQPEILLGPAEADLEAQMTANRGPVPPRIRPESLIELAEALVSCGGFIGNDSAVGHLAGFIGRPTVALFGPTDPIRWAPWGRYVGVVQTRAECGPCSDAHRRECDSAGGCMEVIPPGRVLETFVRLYRVWTKE